VLSWSNLPSGVRDVQSPERGPGRRWKAVQMGSGNSVLVGRQHADVLDVIEVDGDEPHLLHYLLYTLVDVIAGLLCGLVSPM